MFNFAFYRLRCSCCKSIQIFIGTAKAYNFKVLSTLSYDKFDKWSTSAETTKDEIIWDSIKQMQKEKVIRKKKSKYDSTTIKFSYTNILRRIQT